MGYYNGQTRPRWMNVVLMGIAVCCGFAARVGISGLLDKPKPSRVERHDAVSDELVQQTNFSAYDANKQTTEAEDEPQ